MANGQLIQLFSADPPLRNEAIHQGDEVGGDPAVSGGVCEQRYAAERVLPQSRFELEHAGSPSEEAAREKQEEQRSRGQPVGASGMGNLESVCQGGVQAEVDIVEDSGQDKFPKTTISAPWVSPTGLQGRQWRSDKRHRGYARQKVSPPTTLPQLDISPKPQRLRAVNHATQQSVTMAPAAQEMEPIYYNPLLRGHSWQI
jgi:hypothetical protein